MEHHGIGSVATRLQALTDDLAEAFVDCVWTQWTLLGSTAAARRRPGAAPPIDPEALLLASLIVRDREPRLDDVMRGWLHANAALVSVQRLRNLAPHYAGLADGSGRERLRWLAQVALTEAKDARWRGLAAAEGAPVADAASVRARAKTAPPALRPTAAHHLMLRLRLGLGVGIKADVVAFLLGQRGAWHPIRDITLALAYTSAPLRRALDDLADGEFIERRRGHPVRYRAVHARWQVLLALRDDGAAWGAWDARFRFASAWLAWARAPRAVALTEYVFSVEARALLTRHRDAFGFGAITAELAGADTPRVLLEIAAEVGAFAGALRTLRAAA